MCLSLCEIHVIKFYFITDCIIGRPQSIDELSKLRSTIDNNHRNKMKYTEFEDIATVD